MSFAQRQTDDQTDLRVDLARNTQSTTAEGDGSSGVTAVLSRYLGYDLGKRDREKLELLETSAFSAPLVGSSSRISLRLKDVDRTVCRLLEKYNEHARTTGGQGDLSLELSDIASSGTENEGVPQHDLLTKPPSERDPMDSSEYLKMCLTCDKSFNTVEQLVAHFMKKPQNELRVENHGGFQLSVNIDPTTEQNQPLETVSVTKPGTGTESRDNPSSRRLEYDDKAIPLTYNMIEHQQGKKQHSSVNKKNPNTNAVMPQSQSHMLKTKHPLVCGQRPCPKEHTVKSSFIGRPCKSTPNKNKTCVVSSDNQQNDDKTSNDIQFLGSWKRKAKNDFTPPNSSALHTPVMTSATNSAEPAAAIQSDVNTVPSRGRPRILVHSSAIMNTGPQMEATRPAESIPAPVVGPNPLEIMKKLTSLLALYQAKVQRRKENTSSLTLSIPVRSLASIVPPPKSIPIGTVSCKRKYSSLVTSGTSVAECESQCASDTASGNNNAPVCYSVASTDQGSALRQSFNNAGIPVNVVPGYMVPTNQLNTTNGEELNINVSSQSTLCGSHVIHQAEPISTQEIANTPAKPLFPLASSGKWLIYHLPATVISNFTDSQNQSQNMIQTPSIFTGNPANCQSTASTALIFPGGTTPTILRRSLQNPVTGQKVQVQSNQRPVATLTHAYPSSAEKPTPKPAKTSGLASIISKTPTQRLGTQRSAGSLQFHPIRASTTSKTYPKFMLPKPNPVNTASDQAGKHARFPDATSGLLQPSIILQPIRAPPATGRSLLHVPLEIPGQRPHATPSACNSVSPGAVESVIVTPSSSQVSSQSINNTIGKPYSSVQIPLDSSSSATVPCSNAQTPLDGSKTATVPYSSSQIPLDGSKTATMSYSSSQASPHKEATFSQRVSMSPKFPAQRPPNTKVPTPILKPKENVALVSKETDGSCSPQNQKIPGSVALFGHAQAAQRFRGTDKNSPTTREKKRTARAQLACRNKKPKSDSHA